MSRARILTDVVLTLGALSLLRRAARGPAAPAAGAIAAERTTERTTRRERTAAARGARRAALRRPAPSLVVLAVVAVLLPAGTLAAFSDFAIIPGNRAGAGTLVLDGDDEFGVRLPERGTEADIEITVTNTGTTPADLAFSLSADATTSGTLCDGYDEVRHAGELTLQVHRGAAVDLCALDGTPVPLGTTLAPEASVELELTAGLAPDARLRWSGREATFPLAITGVQPGGGFSDFRQAALTIAVGAYAPSLEIPDVCGALDAYRVVHELAAGRNALDLAEVRGPALVTAENGNTTITGTSDDDCIVVGNGKATVSGGPGDDTVVSDDRGAGGGKVLLDGGTGDDHLVARRGSATLRGGDGTDRCDGVPGDAEPSCESGTAVTATGRASAEADRPTAADRRAATTERSDDLTTGTGGDPTLLEPPPADTAAEPAGDDGSAPSDPTPDGQVAAVPGEPADAATGGTGPAPGPTTAPASGTGEGGGTVEPADVAPGDRTAG